MELKAYWLAIKAGWKIILGVLLVAVVAAAVLTWTATPQYVSSTRLFVTAQTGSEDLDELYQRNALAQQRVASYVVLAMSGTVAAQASDVVGYPVSSSAVQAEVVLGTGIIDVHVTDPSATRAHDIAAAYADVIPRMVEELEQVGDSEAAQVKLAVIDEAALPGEPPSPAIRNLLVAILLGLGVGVGLSVLRFVVQRESRAADPGTRAA